MSNPLKSFILSVGDELVLGQTVDTNSAWMSQQLAAAGVAVAGHMTVADDLPAIERAIRACAAQCDFLLISGGLGPTADDLTRQALANVLGVPLETDPAALRTLEAFFRRLNRPMGESNRVQAMLPRGTKLIENTNGTAPGIDAAWQSGDLKQSCRIFVMPGVPKEMKAMFARDVLPPLARAGGGAAIVSRTLHTFGQGESLVGEALGDLMRRGRNPSVGTTVSAGVVSVRVNSAFGSRQQAIEELEKTVADVRGRLGDLIYGQDEQALQDVVAAMLLGNATQMVAGQTLATAESCTGGLVAKLLTDVSGSSAYFRQGWVTYSNEAKASQLGVPAELIAQHGAVSEPVAVAMAEGARERSGSSLGVGVTGIAGPTGGTPEKPVGTVCIGLARVGAPTQARAFRFSGDREFIRDRSAKMALTMVRFALLAKPLPF